MKKINILNVKISQVTMDEAIAICRASLKQSELRHIFTPNPEIIMAAQKDPELTTILNEAYMVIPDGIGVVIGSRILGKPLKERVAGYDLVQNLFRVIAKEKVKVYFLGAGPNVANEAAQNMSLKYPGLEIVGCHDGYFKEDESQQLIDEINSLKVDLLLVGLGCPRQEKWIGKWSSHIKAKLVIGVGGSFDVMSGKVKRAPKIFIRLGLEWFYRLITQPTRAKRMLQLPIFIIKVIQIKFSKGSLNND